MATNENQGSMSFREFKVSLADLLTMDVILRLATFFAFSPAKIDELRNTTESKGQLMVSFMEERGQIKPNDISPLLKALNTLDLHGLVSKLIKLYSPTETSTVKGKTAMFIGFLRSMYQQFYNKIQPIPYIRERVYCVNDVFVESGLKIEDEHPGFDNMNSCTHIDLFNDSIIPSQRVLLEGDPGYGKSTITLQAAYDWCCENDFSPLKNVEVFILLPLRFLQGISSLYQAIKLHLMPGESKLTEEDIEEILLNSQSVVIILDGYDEYPDKDNKKSDILKLIAGKMFANFKVITSTRTAYTPNDLDGRTFRVRLTGFDDKARNEYITKAVAKDDEEAAVRINDLLTNSPVLSDICEVPLFCVMFAHISYEEKGMTTFTSVTSFFKYMLSCFYNHMWRKAQDSGLSQGARNIPNHTPLNKFVFDCLTKRDQQIVWRADKFKKAVGVRCYSELTTIGILIEEQIRVINDKPGTDASDLIQTLTVVRFYHKLFAEWYAAHYLSSYASGHILISFFKNRTFGKINPIDVQFIFRFACGINEKASVRIIKFLKKTKAGNSFASLCFFEQMGNAEEIASVVSDLCYDGVTIKDTDSKLLQRSHIQMMTIASNIKVKVSCLLLEQCVDTFENNTIRLLSGITLPPLQTVERIIINSGKNKAESGLMIELARYGEKCSRLTEIRFHETSDVPLSINRSLIPPDVRSSQVQVYWRPFDRDFRMNFQSGQWEVDDVDYVRDLCSRDVSLGTEQSKQEQRSLIQLLDIASNYNVTVPCLILQQCVGTCENDTITLVSGVNLPPLQAIEKILVNTGEREVESGLIIGLAQYGEQCSNLTEIRFHQTSVMPLSIDTSDIPHDLKSSQAQVYWHPCDCDFRVNFQSGQWEVDDIDYVRDLCSRVVSLEKEQSMLEQRSIIQLLKTASNHNITISCVTMDQSFEKIDKDEMWLTSGIILPKLLTLEKIQIEMNEKRGLTEDDVINICTYALKLRKLTEIAFGKCILPLSFSSKSIAKEIKNMSIKVYWHPFDCDFWANFQSGQWEIIDIDYVRDLCSREVSLKKEHSKLKQWAIIQLLKTASNHNILIIRVFLDGCSPRVNKSDLSIRLDSGLSLPVLNSLRHLSIQDVTGTVTTRTLTNQEFLAFLRYSSECKKLNVLGFNGGYTLPQTVPPRSIPSSLIDRNVKVSFLNKYLGAVRLDFGTGRWKR